MSNPSRRMPTALTLAIGVVMGWGLANHRPPVVKAVGGDRYGDYSLTSGPVSMQYNERTKTQATQDALYFLDYKGARLLTTVPIQRSSLTGSQMIDNFIERDLAADFKIDLERGANPHFLMTPGSLGGYGEGLAPLYVFETTTKQVAVYKLSIQSVGTKASSRFELLEVRPYTSTPSIPNQSP
jgi:hypothetical protein